jgi:CBS domain containing-hemolysin-like protein
MSNTRQHVHELVDRLPPARLAALEGLLETIVPHTELEDEEIGSEEEQAVARSKEWFKHNEGTPLEDVVSELGFTMDQVRSSR